MNAREEARARREALAESRQRAAAEAEPQPGECPPWCDGDVAATDACKNGFHATSFGHTIPGHGGVLVVRWAWEDAPKIQITLMQVPVDGQGIIDLEPVEARALAELIEYLGQRAERPERFAAQLIKAAELVEKERARAAALARSE